MIHLKTLYVNADEEKMADKIVKKGNNIKGFIDNVKVFEYPDISDMSEFRLKEGELFDTEIDFQQQFNDLEMYILMQRGLV